MNTKQWIGGIGVMIILLSSGCTRCGSVQNLEQDQAHKLSIISPHPKAVEHEWVEHFKAYYLKKFGHPVTVEWISQGGTVENVRFIENAFAQSPQGIQVDIFWGGGARPYLKFAAQNYLESYVLPEDVLRHIPKEVSGVSLYDREHRWYSGNLAAFGFIINRAVLTKHKLPLPQTWKDLANPIYANHIISADPRHSGVAHMIFGILLQAYPWEEAWQLLTAMAANTRNYDRYAKNVITTVTSGDAAIGLAIDHYGSEAIAKLGDKDFAFVFPKDITVISPDPIAILKGAPHLTVAQEFVTFLLREENQKLWVLPAGTPGGPQKFTLGRIPVVPHLFDQLKGQSVVSANPFHVTQTFAYDDDKGAKMWSLLNDLIGTMLIDTLPNLKKSMQLVRKHTDTSLLVKLGQVPVTESEALSLAAQWENPTVRNQHLAQWQTFARRKYANAGNPKTPARL